MSCLIEFRWGDAVYARAEWSCPPPPEERGEGVPLEDVLLWFVDDMRGELDRAVDDPGRLAAAFPGWAARRLAKRIAGDTDTDHWRSRLAHEAVRFVGDASWCPDATSAYAIDCRLLRRGGAPDATVVSVVPVAERFRQRPYDRPVVLLRARYLDPAAAADAVAAGAREVRDPREADMHRVGFEVGRHVGLGDLSAAEAAAVRQDLSRGLGRPATDAEMAEHRARMARDYEAHGPTPERTVLVVEAMEPVGGEDAA